MLLLAVNLPCQWFIMAGPSLTLITDIEPLSLYISLFKTLRTKTGSQWFIGLQSIPSCICRGQWIRERVSVYETLLHLHIFAHMMNKYLSLQSNKDSGWPDRFLLHHMSNPPMQKQSSQLARTLLLGHMLQSARTHSPEHWAQQMFPFSCRAAMIWILTVQ